MSPVAERPDMVAFIQARLPVLPVPGIPGIRLHKASASSGLGRLAAESPYWAYYWAGGLALARFVGERPEIVAGRRVLDLGAGSGLVAIAAALAGARAVVAAETDRDAVAALGLNAALNGVSVEAIEGDITGDAPPEVDLVLVGDLFYEQVLAARVTAFLDRCLAAGIEVLIGDPWRAHLPRERLRVLAEYQVAETNSNTPKASAVFAFEPSAR